MGPLCCVAVIVSQSGQWPQKGSLSVAAGPVLKTVNAGKRFSLWLFGPAVSRYALALASCDFDSNRHELVILSAVLPLKAVSLMFVRAAVVRAREV